ncbi:phage portal protein [Paraburkholderia caballeronis]|uniref:phage portal protein n=1 Tax=Paraburkholderia caballeronis TaxID=416943 RepID=UPI001064CB20|nr:phage portal protein [Paraburkholderia caballeronis]TDV04678.1 SPP1 gp7 family putative phage head morphogenesis protein [Paraburkholderia caballeronis]TDV07921.1 SPP1 gp7 family putative phage head morphogenesis protein [Paraburkholderia caballeronis]TDV18212.1 SPP1 gp7 family putative phage head morphogenesis protein [Paraburkholderia caballeronis]
MPDGGKKTPFDPAVVQQVAGGRQPNYGITGVPGYSVSGTSTAWMSPGPGLAPLADRPQDQTRGRQFDYQVNVNLIPRPRTYEQVTFEQLRALADNCDILRLVIENEKDNLAKLKWKFKPRDSKKQPDERCAQLTDFFSMPDQEHTWDEWLRMLLEDLFVIDAPCLFPLKTRGGDVDPTGNLSDWYAFEPMDGATIKRFITPQGRTPVPPDPAYQQILKGLQAVDYTRDELIYRPRNVRTNKIYGYSPVEQILTTVNISIRRALNQLSYYTEGNVPDLLFGVPDTWQPDQIKQFQLWWDSLTSGQSKKKGRFIPGGIAPHDTKPLALKDEYDEWLARVVCYAFSTAPTPFVKQMNRATAQTAQEDAAQEGLLPRMNWIRNLVNFIVWKYVGWTDLEFDWDQEEPLDPLVATQIQDFKVKNGTLSVDEARQEDGREPIGMSNAVYTPTGPVPVVDFDAQEKEKQRQAAEAAANFSASPPGAAPSAHAPDDTVPSGEEPAAKHAHGGVEKKKSLTGTDPDSAAIEQGMKVLTPVLTAFLADQAPKIAAQLARALDLTKAAEDDPRNRADRAVDDLDFSEWHELPPQMVDAYAEVAITAASEALTDLDLFSDAMREAVTKDAATYASARAAELVGMKYTADGKLVPNPDAKWQITEGTRDLIRSTVVRAMESGWSNDQLAKAIAESPGFNAARAENIARTESAFADTAGNIAGWKVSDVVEGKQWRAAPGCCDLCQQLDGEVVGLDDTFSNGSDGAPAHPKCRCAVLPVLKPE